MMPRLLIVFCSLLSVTQAAAYIHFPPPTLAKLCSDSHHVRVLTVKAVDADKGVIVFAEAEALKCRLADAQGSRHLLRAELPGATAVVGSAREGQTAVMFWIEAKLPSGLIGCGYVFLNDGCYSVDYVPAIKAWSLLRVDPEMARCYAGPANKLPSLAKDVLAGREVEVPTRGAKEKRDPMIRAAEVKREMELLRGVKR